MIERAEKSLEKSKLTPELEIETEIEWADLNLTLCQEIEKFSPFGIGNPRPIFATREVEVVAARQVGSGNQHLKLTISHTPSAIKLNAIGFGMGELYSQLSLEKPVDIAYEFSVNQWEGRKKLELKLKDLKIKETDS